MARRSWIERDVVIVACAVSAGIHGALVPEHLDESMGAGLGFVVATVLLAALAVGLTLGIGSTGLVAAVAIAIPEKKAITATRWSRSAQS